ncbi:MAG TPA: tetratricopeptide repeat protein [Anaerolineae bacterium]|nr:tetratricopeptide repeat protein [Anaerolineae bacterium]HQI85530.1 tetratricopeptide repeat protein [Anaerolineae bacterium]
MISRAMTWQRVLGQRRGVRFIGRVREQELFRLNFLYQVPAYLIFALHGPDGVGKSALLTQFRAIAEEHNAVTVRVDTTQATAVREQTILQTMLRMAQQFAEAGTPFTAFEERYEEYTTCTRMVAEDFNTPSGVFDLLGDLAEVQEMRSEVWDKYLFERFGNPTKIALVKTPVETLTQIFVKDMNAWATVRAMLLCFDDWERLGPHLQSWVQDWLTRYEMRTNIWVALASAQPLDETWTDFRPVTATFTLTPFTEDETRAYLAAAGVADPARVTDIVTFSAGLPAMARLLASATGGRAGDLALTPVDRYLKWLETPQRREAVLQCAVPRRLDADVIKTTTDSADPALSTWLSGSPLVVQSPDAALAPGAARYHPELRRRLLDFAQQQAPALVEGVHTRLYDYYQRRSAANGAAVPGGLSLYRDAAWRADKLEALYHGLMLKDAQTIQEGVEIFLAALRVYYPLAGEIAATWQEAAAAQLTANPVAEWGALLHTAWRALEKQDWDAVLAFCDACAQREDASATVQREIQAIRQIVLARLGRFAPVPEEITPEAAETVVAAAAISEEPATLTEPAVPEPQTQESARKETPVKTSELKHEGVAPVLDITAEPLPDEDREAKTTPIPRLQIKETPMKEDLTAPVEPVTPKASLPIAGAPKDEALSVSEAPHTGEAPEIVEAAPTEEPTLPEEPNTPEEPEIPEEPTPTEEAEAPEEPAPPTPHAPRPTPTPDIQAADFQHRAAIYLSMGEYDKAIQEYGKALELDPTFTPAYYDRGLAHAQRQHYADAVADFSQVIALDPQHADAYYNRGLVYARQGAFAQALADYDQALDLHPDDALIYNSRGNVHYNTKDYAQAIADYDQAIFRDAAYADAYLNRGLAHAALEEYQRAIADYNQAIALNPESTIAYNYRGQAYARLQQYARALEDYTQAIALDPNFAVAYNNRGLCYVRLGQHAQAIAEYRQAVIANPQYATAYYNAACAAGLMNNASVACTWLEKAIALNPRYRTLAQRDTDFEYIRGNKKFQALLQES